MRPDLHNPLWRRIRKVVLWQEPYCVGYPTGYHGSVRVRTNSVDHIIAPHFGGLTVRENLRGLCGSCNSRKAYMEEGARTWRR